MNTHDSYLDIHFRSHDELGEDAKRSNPLLSQFLGTVDIFDQSTLLILD